MGEKTDSCDLERSRGAAAAAAAAMPRPINHGLLDAARRLNPGSSPIYIYIYNQYHYETPSNPTIDLHSAGALGLTENQLQNSFDGREFPPSL